MKYKWNTKFIFFENNYAKCFNKWQFLTVLNFEISSIYQAYKTF